MAGLGHRAIRVSFMAAHDKWFELIQQLLDRSHLWRPDRFATEVSHAAARLGLGITLYPVDPAQRFLRPLPQDGRATPAPLPVDGSAAGEAFRLVESVPVRSADA